MTPGVATAQSVIAVADLPAIRMTPKPDYRLTRLDQRRDARSRNTAMLDRLFVSGGGLGLSDHRHAGTLSIGGIEVTGEAMRQRLLSASSEDRKARLIERSWAFGAHADWAVGARDSLSIGVAATLDRRAEPTLLASTTRIKGKSLATDLTWAHDDHLRMSLGWRADSSTSPAMGAERLVEIAQGATLREQGFRLTVGYLLDGAGPAHNAMFGIAARDARVAAEDLAAIGPAGRQDVQAALFFRTMF